MLRIVTDSMSDYIHAPHRDAAVTVVSQPLRFGMTEYLDDGVSITQADFYARLRTAQTLPQTSMVPMQSWLDAFNTLLQNKDDAVLCIAGSSRLSGGCQTALMAAKACRDPRRVVVVDSLSASSGEILLIDYALRLIREGCGLAQLAGEMEELKRRIHLIGLADDLKYLVMGGRLSPLVGKIGGALSIKPTLKLEGGVIEKAGVVRGLKKGYAWYVEQLKTHPPAKGMPLYIGGADCPGTVALIKTMVQEAGIDAEIRCLPIGCLIGTHVGPGLTLVCWTAEG